MKCNKSPNKPMSRMKFVADSERAIGPVAVCESKRRYRLVPALAIARDRPVFRYIFAMTTYLVCSQLADATSTPSPVVFVNQAQTGPADGASWQTAFPDLQDALSAVTPGQEVWVAQGTYPPDSGSGDKHKSFVVPDGVCIFGGFSGTETQLNQRDWTVYITTLSGDLNGDDLPGLVNMNDNARHVVRVQNAPVGVTLDGIRIGSGHAFGGGTDQPVGGGVRIEDGTLELKHCTLDLNASLSSGGALYAKNSKVTIDGCAVLNNASTNGFGGAFCVMGGNMHLGACKVTHNTALDGAAIYASGATMTAAACVFESNATAGIGGAMFLEGAGASIISDSLFVDNGAQTGAGIYFLGDENGQLGLSRCRFLGGSAQSGGAIALTRSYAEVAANLAMVEDSEFIHNAGVALRVDNIDVDVLRCTICGNTTAIADAGAGIELSSGSLHVRDTIIRGNGTEQGTSGPEQQVHFAYTSPFDPSSVNYCDIQGLDASLAAMGDGNFDADPLFMSPAGLDGVAGTADDDYSLQQDSPCVDSGSFDELTGIDIAGVPRWLDGNLDGHLRLDVGGHEFSNVELSTSAKAKGLEVTIGNHAPLFGFLLIGRGADGEFIVPYGQLLLNPKSGLTRYAVGSLPVTVALPWSSIEPSLLGETVNLQALGIVPGTSIGNFSRAVTVLLAAP